MYQQPKKQKQNIIRFPASRVERHKILKESQDVRVRIVSTLRTACGWLAIIATMLFVLSNFHLFTLSSIRNISNYIVTGLQQHKKDISTIAYENGLVSDAVLFESGLAYADTDMLFLAKPGGLITMRQPLGYASPTVEASKNHVLVYDRGGNKAMLATASGAVANLELDSTIITGSVALDGHFTLICDTQGYRTSVAVYNTKGKEVFKFQSSEYYIVSAALAPNSNSLAVLAFKQNGVALESHLLLYSTSDGSLTADAILPDTLGLDVCFLTNNSIAALCDSGLYLINRKGEVDHVVSVAANDLLAFSLQDGAAAIATRSYSSGARSELYSIRANGKLVGPFLLDDEPAVISISEAGVAALSSSGVSVYDKNFAPLWFNNEAVGARRILLDDNGTLFALYTKSARLFTAHSEQSEDISHAK